MKKIRLTELIDVNILQHIQDAFSEYTGMAALTTDEDGVPVTEGSGFTQHCMELGIDEELYLAASRKIHFVNEMQVKRAAKFLAELAAALSDMAYQN